MELKPVVVSSPFQREDSISYLFNSTVNNSWISVKLVWVPIHGIIEYEGGRLMIGLSILAQELVLIIQFLCVHVCLFHVVSSISSKWG